MKENRELIDLRTDCGSDGYDDILRSRTELLAAIDGMAQSAEERALQLEELSREAELLTVQLRLMRERVRLMRRSW